tara:strand:- start:545 stop:754 length:210 start_codon:yes stop_codon:yes gene_type:complete
MVVKEQKIRDELAITIKDLRARGTREINPDAMSDDDIIFNTGYAMALAEVLGKDRLEKILYEIFLSGWD